MLRKTLLYVYFLMFSSSIWAGNLIDIDCKVQSVYGYRADGTPGRVVVINLKGECLKGNCLVDVAAKGYREKSNFVLDAKDSTRIELLLPSELPVGKKVEVAFTFTYAGEKYKRKLTIDPMRYWLYEYA